jgi:hypothetical protein
MSSAGFALEFSNCQVVSLYISLKYCPKAVGVIKGLSAIFAGG